MQIYYVVLCINLSVFVDMVSYLQLHDC